MRVFFTNENSCQEYRTGPEKNTRDLQHENCSLGRRIMSGVKAAHGLTASDENPPQWYLGCHLLLQESLVLSYAQQYVHDEEIKVVI